MSQAAAQLQSVMTEPVPLWLGHYLLLPFKSGGRDRTGLDDWGLVRQIYGEQYGIGLASLIKISDQEILSHLKETWSIKSKAQKGDLIAMCGVFGGWIFGVALNSSQMITTTKQNKQSCVCNFTQQSPTFIFRYRNFFGKEPTT